MFDPLRTRLRRWQECRSFAARALQYSRLGHRGERRPEDPRLFVNFPEASDEFYPPLFMPTEIRRKDTWNLWTIKMFFIALYRTLHSLGYSVNQCAHDEADLVMCWSQKRKDMERIEPKIFGELGWLPRWTFQISPDGSNARSHIARNYRAGTLDAADQAAIKRYLGHMRTIFGRSVRPERVQAVTDAVDGKPFALFAFQLATDFNLKFSGSQFAEYYARDPGANPRFAQACVDYAMSHETPLPVVFKQHPMDRTNLNGRLSLPRDRAVLWDRATGYTTHEIFASGLCKLVITVNSNTIHEASAWGVPGICLGNLVWTSAANQRPYHSTCENMAGAMSRTVTEDGVLLHYLTHVVRNQWTINDLLNPCMVEALVQSGGRCEPFELRRKLGLVL